MLGTSRILTLVFTDLADSTGLKTRHERLVAGLRDAEAMYRSMGMPDPAERLAREVAS